MDFEETDLRRERLIRRPMYKRISARSLTILGVALWSLVVSPAPAARFEPDRQEIDAGMQAFLRARSIPSAVIGVYDGEGLILARAYGLADKEKRIAATIDTRYQIGSITKLFTASLVMGLRDERRLRLDDSIGPWLSETSENRPIANIILRDLLTHSSGLPANPVNRVDADGVMQPYSLRNLLEGLRSTQLSHPRGTRAGYSNLGYGILGRIVELASGEGYAAALSTRLLDPLGMRSTIIDLSPAQEAGLARHYWFQDPQRLPRKRWVFGEIAGFGGIVSTAPDLAKFLSFQLRDGTSTTPLSRAALAEMQRAHIRWQPGYEFGLGWQIWRSPGLGDIHTHGGEVDGHGSYAAFSKGLGVGVVVLTNLGGPTATDLGDWLLAKVVEDARTQQHATEAQASEFSFQENWSDAAWAWRQVARTHPERGRAFYQLGVAEFNLGRLDRALAALGTALAMGFDKASAEYLIARAQAVRGNPRAAILALQRAAKAGFRGTAALENKPEFEVLKSDPAWSGIIQTTLTN